MEENLSAQAVPATPAQSSNRPEEEITTFDNKEGVSLSMILLWVTAVVGIGMTVFLWFLSSDVSAKIESFKSEKTTADAWINSPTNLKTMEQAAGFDSAVTELQKAKSERYSMDDFLSKFYGQVNKDIKVNNLAISSAGLLSFDATTTSYRSAADQMLTLQNWTVNSLKILKDVQIATVSESIGEDGKATVPFSISAAIDKTASLVEAVAATTDSSTATDSAAVSATSSTDTTLPSSVSEPSPSGGE